MSIGTTLTIGLVRGRHEMPVVEYIWDEIPDVLDFPGMEHHAREWLEEHTTPVTCSTNDFQFLSWERLDDPWTGCAVRALVPYNTPRRGECVALYVTGLTAAVIAVVKAASQIGCRLTLYHYDRESGAYKPQTVLL